MDRRNQKDREVDTVSAIRFRAELETVKRGEFPKREHDGSLRKRLDGIAQALAR